MAFPLTYHRITNSNFRSCSTCLSRSQARFCVYTHCTISVRAEPTFERLRYLLGGDRPSQTARLTVSPDRIHGRRLEFQYPKGDSALADANVSMSPTYPVHALPIPSIKLQ